MPRSKLVLFTLLVVAVGILAPFGWATPAGAVTNPPQQSITCDETGVHTARLYQTLFDRTPDDEGLAYWVRHRRAGLSAESVAYWMTQSREFQLLHGDESDAEYIHSIYENLLGRPADPGGHAYWLDLLRTHGRHGVANWITHTDEFTAKWPFHHSDMCARARFFGLTEVLPGIAVGQTGSTIIVVADRALVDFRATDGGRTFASRVAGDIVVNANWFFGSTSQAPVVSDGRVSGSPDILERGQIVRYRAGCGQAENELEHVWTWQIYHPNPCVVSAVSGVSLIHNGERADAVPGIDLRSGYTNSSTSHSFLGFNENEIVVISTNQMNASQLADLGILMEVDEAVMLDGGGSTQIKTPTASLWSSRSVPSFAILDSRAK